MSKSEATIIVTGDVAMDWNLARARRTRSDVSFWSADDTTCTTWQCGGAALLADLIEAIAKERQKSGTPQFSVRQTGAPRKSNKVQPDSEQYHHSYAMWSPVKYGDKPAWRVEEFLGSRSCQEPSRPRMAEGRRRYP